MTRDTSFQSWNRIEKYVRIITYQIKDDVKEPNKLTFIGIERGGVIPAMLLAQTFNAKYDLIKIEDFENNKTVKWYPYDKWGIYDKNVKYENPIIVDDISDTGKTLEYVMKHVRLLFMEDVPTATLIHKTTSKYIPTYSGLKTDTKDWLMFPWEK